MNGCAKLNAFDSCKLDSNVDITLGQVVKESPELTSLMAHRVATRDTIESRDSACLEKCMVNIFLFAFVLNINMHILIAILSIGRFKAHCEQRS